MINTIYDIRAIIYLILLHLLELQKMDYAKEITLNAKSV